MRALYDYWTRQRQGRAFPRREDIDPVDIPRLLPSLMLLEVHAASGGGHRFRFRLAGTAICDIAGVDLTGRWLDEMFYPGPYVGYLVRLNEEVVRRARATYTETRLMLGGGAYSRTTARVICPLGEAPDRVTMILAAQTFDSRPQWTPLAEEVGGYDFTETRHEILA